MTTGAPLGGLPLGCNPKASPYILVLLPIVRRIHAMLYQNSLLSALSLITLLALLGIGAEG